jgi:hypothetical protein
MTDSGQPPNAKFEAEDELDYLFANASPNPNREGCPSRDELVRVSRHEKPMGDPVYLHIVRCSPCFQEMRGLQQAHVRARRARMWAIAAAAVVVVIVGSSWWTLRSPRTTDVALVATTIDLRPFTVMRGDTQSPPPASVVIPRGRLDATIVLPLGAEAGSYEVRLLDDVPSVRAQATGEAEIRDSVTTLHATLDAATLPAGAYHLEVRRAGGEWRRVPARLN